MKQNPPIKRSKPLIPLSHDHYQGLIAVRRIREGLTRAIHHGRIAAYVRDFWDRELARHFSDEEILVFPMLPEGDELMQRAVAEHHQLQEYMDRLDEPGVLAAFASLLEAHIRFEERVLFAHIEHSASPTQMAQAGADLQHQHAEGAICWSDAFWKE
jgi:iron-sulfur cluster repair protein YtfE (RIC family)